MDYKKSRELLLNSEALSLKDAKEILDFWQKSPRAYSDLLRNPGAFQLLEAYSGIDRKEVKHEFIITKHRVPSAAIAQKFFRLEDDEISTSFIKLLASKVIKDDDDVNICAWPYLNQECMVCLGSNVIVSLITGMFFVFDFNQDTEGRLFDTVYRLLNSEFEQNLLALNSFNIIGWTSYLNAVNRERIAHYYLMSSHAFPEGICEEAAFRKMMINYLVSIDEGLVSILRKMKEAEGQVYN